MDRIADTDIHFIEECSYVSAFSKQRLYTKSMVGDTQKDEPPVVEPPSTSTPTATPETLDVFHTPEFDESLYPVDQCRLNEASCDVDVEFIDVEAYECTLNKASFDVDTEFINLHKFFEEDEDASHVDGESADGESSGIQGCLFLDQGGDLTTTQTQANNLDLDGVASNDVIGASGLQLTGTPTSKSTCLYSTSSIEVIS